MFKLKMVGALIVAFATVTVILLTMQGMLPTPRSNNPHVTDLERQSNKVHSSSLKGVGTITMDNFDVTKADLLAESLPESVTELAKEVKDDEKRIKIQGIDTFYREALPPSGVTSSKLTVVLLHGMNFKSQTWVDLGTFKLLAALGHRVIAFDLPGYGNTPGEKIPEQNRGSFLNEALELLHVEKPIVVSPSMSGSFSLPYLLQFKGKMGGYVPVAPIFTEKYSDKQYHSINTSTLIIYGELDEQLGDLSTNNLRKLPNSQVQMLPKARHPAYLDQPELFHKLLHNFLLKLKD